MSSSDPGLIVIYYFRKMDNELVDGDPSHPKVKQFYELLSKILGRFSIQLASTPNQPDPYASRFLGKGNDDGWNIRAFDNVSEIVLLGKAKSPIKKELIENIRSQKEFESYSFFYEVDRTGWLLAEPVSGTLAQELNELLELSPSSQQSLIFDVPVADQQSADDYTNRLSKLEPRFPGCDFSLLESEPILVGRIEPLAVKHSLRREVLLMVYPDSEVVNRAFARHCWESSFTNSLPSFANYLCSVAKCAICHSVAIALKRDLEVQTRNLIRGNQVQPGLLDIRQDYQKVLKESGTKNHSVVSTQSHELAHKLEMAVSMEDFGSLNDGAPRLARYAHTFDIWRHEAISSFGSNIEKSLPNSYLRNQFSKIEAWRVDLSSAMGYVTASTERVGRMIEGINAMVSSLNLRVSEQRLHAEERFSARFHFLEIFVIAFYTLYLSYILHTWAGIESGPGAREGFKKAAIILSGFLLFSVLFVVVVLSGAKTLFGAETVRILFLVFLACVSAFLLNVVVADCWQDLVSWMLDRQPIGEP